LFFRRIPCNDDSIFTKEPKYKEIFMASVSNTSTVRSAADIAQASASVAAETATGTIADIAEKQILDGAAVAGSNLSISAQDMAEKVVTVVTETAHEAKQVISTATDEATQTVKKIASCPVVSAAFTQGVKKVAYVAAALTLAALIYQYRAQIQNWFQPQGETRSA
jgi:hypothetical protein